ncbi:MAG: hypothetical protein QOF82_387 [Frankiales bacterium]|jgi:hypothetical protein|nr:hypothetical protein [Frankiales bacterium]MDX6210086.1 hypothetical protein [Frankiales bacterium]MDX6211300.1 hypothetical protein [Frankiales bacterium]
MTTPSADETPDQAPADDVRAKFRAALDKKHGTTGANATPHTPGSSAVPHSNDKRTRQFRRKSGG